MSACGIWKKKPICAAGAALAEELLGAQGDLGSFRTMQRQPAWRGKPREAQLRRFLGAGSYRKLRYARLLVDAIDLNRMPKPLDACTRRRSTQVPEFLTTLSHARQKVISAHQGRPRGS